MAALLRYPLPGIDDIEEEDIDIDELINEEAQSQEDMDDSRSQSTSGGAGRKKEWDEEQLYQLLSEVGDMELQEGEEEEEG